jgi:hypothetical protein
VIDIVTPSGAGLDAGAIDTSIYRAGNILSVQIGNLEYAPDLGIDLAYFLSEDFIFQNESFKSYLVQILANYSINVESVIEVINSLYTNLTFKIPPSDSGGGLIAR